MIFVDTSVWIAGFRGTQPRLTSHLEELLDQDTVALPAPVRIEILAGAKKSELSRLARLLSALPTFLPSGQAWKLAEEWISAPKARGDRFGFADLLIAAITAEQGGALWTLDQDFARMEKLGFIDLYKAA